MIYPHYAYWFEKERMASEEPEQFCIDFGHFYKPVRVGEKWNPQRATTWPVYGRKCCRCGSD